METGSSTERLTDLEHRFFRAGMRLRVRVHKETGAASHLGDEEWPECVELSKLLDEYMDQYGVESRADCLEGGGHRFRKWKAVIGGEGEWLMCDRCSATADCA